MGTTVETVRALDKKRKKEVKMYNLASSSFLGRE